MLTRASGGSSCQVGTIQNSGVMSTGANCDCVRRTQSCSGTCLTAMMLQPSKKSWGSSRSRASSAACCERSEEHTSELQSRLHLVCRLLLEKKKHQNIELVGSH